MSAMEGLLRTVLNVSGVDIDEVKREVTTRIAAFERNVETLNSTLIQHHKKLDTIETNLAALFAHLGLTYIESAAFSEPPPPAPAALTDKSAT